MVLAHEDENEYPALYEGLLKEHQPATETEQILVKKMAQHQWMADRALYQQANCFYKRFLRLRKTDFAVHALSHHARPRVPQSHDRTAESTERNASSRS